MRSANFFAKLALITPAFFGMLFVPNSWYQSPQWIEVLLRQAGPLFLFLLFSAVFRSQLLSIKPRATPVTAQTKRDELLLIFNLFFASVSVVLSLAYISQHYAKIFFLICLLNLILGILADRLGARDALVEKFIARYFFFCTLAYLSCLAFLGVVQWQTLALSAAIASALVSLEGVQQISDAQISRDLHAKLYSFTVCLGPVIIAALAMLRELPRAWLLALVPLALSQRHLQALRELKEPSNVDRKCLVREATGIYWLFVLSLVLIRICFRWS